MIYVIAVVYRMHISYHTRMVHTVRVRYVPYVYGMIFCTIRVWLYRMRICFIQHKTFYREWRLYAKGLLLIQKQAQKATCMSHHV